MADRDTVGPDRAVMLAALAAIAPNVVDDWSTRSDGELKSALRTYGYPYGMKVTVRVLAVGGDSGQRGNVQMWEPIWDRLSTTAGVFKIEGMSRASINAHIFDHRIVTVSLSERGRVYLIEAASRHDRTMWLLADLSAALVDADRDPIGMLSDWEAMDDALADYVNGHDFATVDDFDAMSERLSSCEWSGVR